MNSLSKNKFRIGLVGFGIGKTHAWAFRNIPHFYDDIDADQIELIGISTAHEKSAKAAAEKYDFPFFTSDYEELLNHPDIDIVCVGVPDYLHAPVVKSAIKAGKSIYCEKPLAYNLSEAKEMTKLAVKAGIVHQMAFQMRFGPAVMAAKQIIENGQLGEVFTYRCNYQHSGYEDPSRPLSWRLDSKQSGGGALYDLGTHAIDGIRFLLGDYKRITTKQKTFIKNRPISKGSEKQAKVLVDDVTFLLAEMQNGTIGSIEATRLATGIRRGPEITVHGSEGSLRFNLYSQPELLEVYLKTPMKAAKTSGFEKLQLGPRSPIPLEIASQYNFLKNLEKGKSSPPDFVDGLKVQEVLAASKESSEEGKWIDLPQ